MGGPEESDLTPEEEAWCENFFRNLFPEDEEPSGSSDA